MALYKCVLLTYLLTYLLIAPENDLIVDVNCKVMLMLLFHRLQKWKYENCLHRLLVRLRRRLIAVTASTASVVAVTVFMASRCSSLPHCYRSADVVAAILIT